MPGPAIATVPVRVQLNKQRSIQEYLRSIQTQAAEMVAFEQLGLQEISKLSPDADEACKFSTLLVIQPLQHLIDNKNASMIPADEDSQEDSMLRDYFSYPLVAQGHINDDQINLAFVYDSNLIPEQQVQAMSCQLEHIIRQLVSEQELQLEALSLSCSWDLEFSQQVNEEVPEIISSCIHTIIEHRAKTSPDTMAVHAWDKTFTYSQLNNMANRLAHYLMESGVKPHDLVLVCFDKSAWHFISVLAINKAGAAWVPIDPSHPRQRQQQIASQTTARLTLASANNGEKCRLLTSAVIEVSSVLQTDLMGKNYSEKDPSLQISPKHAAYVLFTSGSTGVPKGLIMEHGAVCTSQTAISKRLGLSSRVKMLQFASFVFDLSIGEIIAPLLSGACICVPSEETRMNGLTEFIRDAGVNWAFLTPSFIRTLQPADVPSLELVLLAGEPVPRDVLDSWFGKVRLINGWGPAETCVFSTLHEWKSANESPLTIGKPVGGSCWIVDPEDHNRLAAVGTIGEVIIQGPTLLREYLADPDRTNAAIVQAPGWMPLPDETHWNKCYKSGDLGYLNFDGTIEFSSRKDTQIKIHGLRIEASEVEFHIQRLLTDARQVAVDVFKNNKSSALVAYFCLNDETKTTSIQSDVSEALFLSSDEALRNRLGALVGELGVILPRYMVPTMFIPCKYMPFSTSTKLDRKLLHERLSSLNLDQRAAYSLSNRIKRQPETEMETRLQTIWAEILNVPTGSISKDDTFFQLGGDSIMAMYLVSAAKEDGIAFAVKDVFDDPRLSAVASKATLIQDDNADATESTPDPFSLLSDSRLRLVLGKKMRQECELQPGQTIKDAFPCSPLQEGLIALTVKQPGSYVATYVYHLSKSVDIFKFKDAWDTVVEVCSNLRTRMVLLDGATTQLVLDNDSQWQSAEDQTVDSMTRSLRSSRMGYGTPLCRYAIVSEKDENYFIWLAHHSIYDGWTTKVMFSVLYQAYSGGYIPEIRPYSSFIKYVRDLDGDAAMSFWKKELSGATQASFPPLPTSPHKAETQSYRSTISFTSSARSSITQATILRAAWSIVLARYCDSNEALFGVTVSGRQAPITGADMVSGPMIATVPLRVRLDKQASISEFLHHVQRLSGAMTPYEQYGLQRISKVSTYAKDACDFSTLLVIQPPAVFRTDDAGDALFATDEATDDFTMDMDGYFTYPLAIIASLLPDSFDLNIFYDSAVLAQAQVQALVSHLDHVVQQLLITGLTDDPLSSVSLLSPWDIQHAVEANRLSPSSETCVHWLIQEQIRLRPNDKAITSWEGELTYSQVGRLASRLASKLQERGVGPEVLVLLCFPKSMYAVIAMLAVEMAGGAFVPLDPAFPVTRLQEIVKGTQAALAIGSPMCSDALNGLEVEVLLVDETILSELPDPSHTITSTTKPEDASLILFTSGSTGRPKAIVIQHNNVCSSSDAYGAVLGIGPGTRVFQYSAYTFDVGILDCFVSLMRGACLCIPSDHARVNDLSGAIRSTKADWVFLTPTVADLLSPAEVPSLKVLCLGGEAISKKCADRWVDHVELHGLYGPAEASICAWNPTVGRSGRSTNIGQPLSSAFWVVEPSDPRQPVPVGCIGELLIEGPMLARGYLNVSDDVAANWMEDVDWLPGGNKRVYRTGDLVRRNADATFDFMGRKDLQVKTHGQRIELGEIESRIQEFLPHNMAAIVHLAKADDGSSSDVLFAFLWYTKGETLLSQPFRLLETVSEQVKGLISHLSASLATSLPTYMIPSSYLVFEGRPEHTTSGKVNRRSLINYCRGISIEDRLRFTPDVHDNESPTTRAELQLRDLWAQVLDMDNPTAIGKHDSFLQLGGDSISAIHLVSLARRHDINLSVASIFDNPRLSSMAESIQLSFSEQVDESAARFKLISSDSRSDVQQAVMTQCNLSDPADIEDVYSCTGLQQSLMALTIAQPGSYISKNIYRLNPDIDVDLFKLAWEQTILRFTNLRTRLVLSGSTTVQAVIHEPVDWSHNYADLCSFALSQENDAMEYGSRLCRYAIISQDCETYFALNIHYSIFDWQTLSMVIETLQAIYTHSTPPSLIPYTNFIQHVMDLDRDAARRYWSTQLSGARRTAFPMRVTSNKSQASRKTNNVTNKLICFPQSPSCSTTLIRAAWSIILAQYERTDDVCFGTTVSGRQASVEGLDQMPGSTQAAVPIRVRLDKWQTVSSFLQDLQTQASEMSAYEQYGLSIISRISASAQDACNFRNFLIIQPDVSVQDAASPRLLHSAAVEDLTDGKFFGDGFNYTYPLVVRCQLLKDKMRLALIYDSDFLHSAQANALLEQFDYVLEQLRVARGEETLSTIYVASPRDLKQAIHPNKADLEPSESRQAKIRGQWVELNEIEAQIKLLSSQIRGVAADVIISDIDESLIAFITFEDEAVTNETAVVQLVPPSNKMQEHLSHIGRDLAAVLPVHMVPKYLVPVKHMPLNACGIIDRAALIQTAMALSTATLGRYLASQHPPFRDCSSSLEHWIRSHWAITLDIPVDTIGIDDNFYQLGGDSIQVITILRLVKDNFGVPIEKSFGGNHITVSNMAEMIETALEDETTAPCHSTSDIDLLAEISSICSASWISHPHALQANPITTIRDQSTIFLTGATGFLGTEILKQLVRNPAVRSVIVHVRSKSIPDGMRRIQETAKIAGWWREEDADKLEVWLGDLSEPRLGLNEAQWKRLSGLSESESSINAIIHNGASVNWHAAYDTLCHPNVNSTVDLLMVAATSPTQPKFVFVSGGAFTNPDDHRAISAAFLKGTTAYIQTKFVCEEVIKKITRSLPANQNRVSIVKPGRIIGTTESGGVANVDDFIWRVVATASSLSAYPEEPEAHWNFIQDASSVASGILNQVFDGAITPLLISGSGMSIPVFWDLVNSELETPCRPIPWSEWLERATAEIEEVGGKHPLWTVQKFLRQLGVPRNVLNYKGMEYTEYKEAQLAVKSNVRYLKSIGFISPGNGFGNMGQENVIRRVHAVRKSA